MAQANKPIDPADWPELKPEKVREVAEAYGDDRIGARFVLSIMAGRRKGDVVEAAPDSRPPAP